MAAGTGPLERRRTANVAADLDAATVGDQATRPAAWVRGMAHRDGAWARRTFGGLAATAVVLLVAGFVGKDSGAVTATVFPLVTLVALGAATVALGRYVRISSGAYRRIALVNAVLLCFLIVAGAAVRLTGSGLGCTDWPTCNGGRIVPQSGVHAWIEFGNRLVTDVCVLAATIGAIGALVRVPYRRDLPRLGGLLIVAIMGNAVLGGIVVLSGLKPQIVMGHFLLAVVAVAIGILMYHRSGESTGGPLSGADRVPVLNPRGVLIARALTISALVTITLGTIVTGSGPHGGDPREVDRFSYSMRDMARLHSGAAWITVALVLALAWVASRTPGPFGARLRTRLTVLLVVLMAQGTVGYVQWFNQVPVGLVQIHVLGAVLMWASVLWARAAVTVPAAQGSSVPSASAPVRMSAQPQA